MTLSIKISKGIEYMYFQAGKDSIYIGPKGDPGKAKTDNVVRALEYARERTDHYAESFDELLPLLPARMHEQHVSKEVARLQGRIARYNRRLSAKSKK